MLGLAMVEGIDGVARQLFDLAEDGLLPRYLGKEWRCSHARTGAALLAGLVTAALAVCLSMKSLVQVGAAHFLLYISLAVLFYVLVDKFKLNN